MLDAAVRRIIDPTLDRVGAYLASKGFGANAVTLVGLSVGLAAAVCIWHGEFWAALLLIAISRIADGLDGAIARSAGTTDFGGYLDITSDFFFYGAIPLGFVLHNTADNGVAGAILLLSFYVNGASFLGFAILAEKRGLTKRLGGYKNFFYSGGLLEGTETIGFFFLICLLPEFFSPLAVAFSGMCFLTAVLRVQHARRVFSDG